jgi:NADH-quinone oxidoreductase subunit M
VTLHLSVMLWMPAVLGLVALVLPKRAAGWVALLGSLGALGYAIALVVDYDKGGALQNVTEETWIAALGMQYKLGVDGINLFLVLLTTLAFSAAVLWAVLEGRRERERQFFFWMSLGHTAVLGALLAQDLALFVAFFDLMLVPFFFLTGVWGGPNRVAAVTKLFIYTLVGSLLMLAAAIATGVRAGGDAGPIFELTQLQTVVIPEDTQRWIFLCFAAAFLVKMPAFPFHGWMPDGYREMPLPALAVFSAVLSKVAAYGFLRIVMPLFPDAVADFQVLMLLLALASILYGSVMAFTTTEARLILGYSSMAQLGFIVLGVFALEQDGAQGAILQSFNHGVVTVPAFFIVGLLIARAGGSQDIRDMGGVAFRAPVFAALFLVVALATLAMPGSGNFVGEFLILLGVFRDHVVIACVAFAGVVMASVYMLRFFIRSMHNRVAAPVGGSAPSQPPRLSDRTAESRDLRFADVLVLAPLVAVIVALALYPQLPIEKGVRDINGSIAQSQLADGAPEAEVDLVHPEIQVIR